MPTFAVFAEDNYGARIKVIKTANTPEHASNLVRAEGVTKILKIKSVSEKDKQTCE